MAIIDQPINVYSGEGVQLTFTMTPVENITGWTILFTAARALASTTKLFEQQAQIIDPTGGVFRVPLVSGQTLQPPDTYKYDAWRIDDGNERLLVISDLHIRANARLPLAV